MDRRTLTAEDNPHGVRKGQTWETRDGQQFYVGTEPRWLTVRGKWVPGVITQNRRTGYRSLAGFARLRLVKDVG